jgi:hypothetical protein
MNTKMVKKCIDLPLILEREIYGEDTVDTTMLN